MKDHVSKQFYTTLNAYFLILYIKMNSRQVFGILILQYSILLHNFQNAQFSFPLLSTFWTLKIHVTNVEKNVMQKSQ